MKKLIYGLLLFWFIPSILWAAWPTDSSRTKNWGSEVLTDSDLEAQFDLLHTYLNDAFDETTGHKHDGTANEGSGVLSPVTLNLSTVNVGSATISGTWSNLGSITTVDINGGTVNDISSLSLSTGATITELSIDGTLAGDSDTAVPTEKATKTYVDAGRNVAFQAGKTAQNNIAIDSDVTITFDSEIFDTGADFASNTFTAPVTGKYILNLSLQIGSIDSAATSYVVRIVTSNRTYSQTFDPQQFAGDFGNWGITLSFVADMDASDTASCVIRQNGGTQQADISSATVFSGSLLGI